MATYPLGQSVRLELTYRAPDGRLTDPSEATLRLRKPSGAVLEYAFPATMERVSDGRYAVVVTANLHGRWLGQAEGLGPMGSTPAKGFYFDVLPGF